MQEINKALGISTKLSTFFYPQTDGQMQIVNKEAQKFLQIYCFEKQDQWADWLAIAQFAINSKKHLSTKIAPFEATQSYVPHMGREPLTTDKTPATKDITSNMEGMLGSMRKSKRADEAQCQ